MANDDTDFGEELSSTPQQDKTQASYTGKAASRNDWKRVGIGAAAGIVLGGAGIAYAHAPQQETPTADDEAAQADAEAMNSANGRATASSASAVHPAWADESISVATGVTDDMSFSEAFAAARAEVGKGGAFEWHGKIYGTYYATEWDSMSADEKNDYASHFSWTDTDAPTQTTHHESHTPKYEDHTADVHGGGEDVNPIKPTPVVNPDPTPTPTPTPDNDTVQVLGVVHDDEHNVNVAAISDDGQDIYLVDADNDLKFDIAISDLNHDEQIQDNEIADISAAGITVDDLGGFTNPAQGGGDDDLLASNGGPDYVNDADGVYDL